MKQQHQPPLPYLSLAEATPLCGGVSRESVRLWIVRGARVQGKKRPVRLMAHFIGGNWFTTAEWIRDYIEATTAGRVAAMPDKWQQERAEAERVLGGRF